MTAKTVAHGTIHIEVKPSKGLDASVAAPAFVPANPNHGIHGLTILAAAPGPVVAHPVVTAEQVELEAAAVTAAAAQLQADASAVKAE